jgi:drug/metabolite transporter (DMT)-like permease
MPLPTGMFALPYASPFFWSLPMTMLLLCELAADFLGKQWTLQKKSILFKASLSLYVLGNAFWLFAVLNGVGLSRGAILFAVGQEIATVSMGIFYFKESLNAKQKIGLLLGIFTIVIMGGA